MSLGYAEKLSFIEDVGNVGMTEFFDSSHILQEKVRIFFFTSFSFFLNCPLFLFSFWGFNCLWLDHIYLKYSSSKVCFLFFPPAILNK